MPGPLPDGEPVPADGSLPDDAVARAGRNGFGVYVHVPFCASRCGYCDFNTYTASEASQEGYLDALLGELRDVPEVVLVTVQLRGGRSWEGQANGEITAARSRWPNVRVADWKAASDPHPEYTGEDGIHLSSSGAQAYAATIAAAL